MEFGWSHATIGSAVSVNLLLYGLMAPFTAALMDRFGIRRVVSIALVLVAVGSRATVFMTEAWQLVLCWGLLVGLGVGSVAMPFVATITGRWFVRSRGLVTGVLTAASATGQLIFLPLVAALATTHGWRVPAIVYDLAFFIAGGLCAAAALMSAIIARRVSERTPASPPQPSTVG